MAEFMRCDGGCGAESPDPVTKRYEGNSWMNLIVNRENKRNGWYRLRLCQKCAAKLNLPDERGAPVSTSGFASDVLS